MKLANSNKPASISKKTYENHLKDTDAFSKTFSNLTADDITATINAKKEIFSYSSLKKIYLFWSAMIKTAISLGELPKNFSDILNRVIMPGRIRSSCRNKGNLNHPTRT